jgi:hypothetical protein
MKTDNYYFAIDKGRTHTLSIRGSGNNDILEKVHLKFCKIILNLKATTPNCMIYGELGRYPLDIDIKLRNIFDPVSIFACQVW